MNDDLMAPRRQIGNRARARQVERDGATVELDVESFEHERSLESVVDGDRDPTRRGRLVRWRALARDDRHRDQ